MASPVTTPELLPTVAIAVPALHVPLPAPSVNVIVVPTHMFPGPDMLPASGVGFTVSAFIAAVPQPVL